MINVTLVTIHGFWSSPATWERLNAVWSADEQLRGLRIHPFEYPSPKKPRLPFSTTRVPDYDDIAQTLATEYTVQLVGAPAVAIVTHSQGGLILQRFLTWMLHQGRGGELARICSIVMLACPNGGSEYLRSLRHVLGFGRHAQAGSLEVLNRQVADTQRSVLKHIVNATVVDDHHCRIPIHVYAGSSDKVVTAASAQGAFPGASTLAGNHFTILDPTAPGSRTAETVKRHIFADSAADLAQSPQQISAVDAVTSPASIPSVAETKAAAEKFRVDVRDSQGVIIGDHANAIQSFGAPLTQPGKPDAELQQLEPHYDQSPAYRHPAPERGDWIIEHRVGVFNPPGQPERRARIYLVSMEPRPRHVPQPRFEPVIPYAVPLFPNGDPLVGHTIGPGQEELWIIGYTGTGSDGIMRAGGFSDQRWWGLPWEFDPDERWRLSYRVECDGVLDVKFSIVVTAEDGQPRLRKES